MRSVRDQLRNFNGVKAIVASRATTAAPAFESSGSPAHNASTAVVPELQGHVECASQTSAAWE